MIARFAALLAMLAACGCAGQTLPADSAPPPAVGGSPGTPTGAPRGAGPPAAGTGAGERRSYVFPIRGRTSYSRAHHDYPATDIFARCGTRVVAPVSGVVLEASRRDRYRPERDNPALRGGRFFSLRGDDGARYYGSHLRSVARSARPGERVRAGQVVGRVGQSGNARGVGCHVHFGISPVCARTGDWRTRRGTVWPYRFLRAWERDRDRSPARAVRRWRSDHGCPGRAAP